MILFVRKKSYLICILVFLHYSYSGGGILALQRSLPEGSYIFSPLFESQDKWGCFRFWYFIQKGETEYEPLLELYCNNTAGVEKRLWKTTQGTLRWQYVQAPLHADNEIRYVGHHLKFLLT